MKSILVEGKKYEIICPKEMSNLDVFLLGCVYCFGVVQIQGELVNDTLEQLRGHWVSLLGSTLDDYHLGQLVQKFNLR